MGCAGKEQTDLKEALTAKLKDDSDLQDYKIDAADVAQCVVGEITTDLPGFPGDPRRERFYQAYVRFVNVKSPDDADKSIAEYQELFGSVKKAREAATNITNYVMTCMGQAIERSGGQRQ
jgi:hypothetical protein